jgi:hypothetical protein
MRSVVSASRMREPARNSRPVAVIKGTPVSGVKWSMDSVDEPTASLKRH